MKAVAAVLLLSAVTTLAAADTPPPELSRDEVRALLGGVDTPPDLRVLARHGVPARRAIVRLYRDPATPRHLRLRSLYAVSAFVDEPTYGFLRTEARQAPHPLLRREAVLSLDRAFGARALTDFTGALGDDDADVREVAVRCLDHLPQPAATSALRARLEVERSPRVRRAIERALRGR